MATEVTLEGLGSLETYFERFPEVATRAARLAINTVAARRGRTLAMAAMQEEIEFPRGYLNDRLVFTKRATDTSLEAVITGRKRATSLARFASSQVPGGTGGGVRMRVKRGRSTFIRSAFLVRLRRGASLTEDNYNVGLAVRLSPGERLRNKVGVHKSWLVRGSVALLYGPSVDQVFRTVAPEIAPEIGELAAIEFFRQFERLS